MVTMSTMVGRFNAMAKTEQYLPELRRAKMFDFKMRRNPAEHAGIFIIRMQGGIQKSDRD